jgi:hypothetical protein
LRNFIFRIMFFIIVHCVLYFRYDYDGIFEATPGCRRAVRTAIEAAEKNGIKVIPFRPFGLREAFKLNSSYRGAFIYNVYTFLLSLANMGTYRALYTQPLVGASIMFGRILFQNSVIKYRKISIKVIPFRSFGLREAFKLNS